MNALFEFIILGGASFFLFMFLAYRDAVRKTPPTGMIAKQLNKLKDWEYTDGAVARGYVYRQPWIIKIFIAVASAAVIRIVYAVFFDFVIPMDGSSGLFSGISGFLLHAAIIFAGIVFSYLWPQVQSKASDIKRDAMKKGEDMAASGKEKAADFASEAKEKAAEAGSDLRKTGEKLADEAKKAADKVAEKGKEAVDKVKENVKKFEEKKPRDHNDDIDDFLRS